MSRFGGIEIHVLGRKTTCSNGPERRWNHGSEVERFHPRFGSLAVGEAVDMVGVDDVVNVPVRFGVEAHLSGYAGGPGQFHPRFGRVIDPTACVERERKLNDP